MGRIVTFYSFKGGVGRSMSLANVAVLLANWGHKVLVIDFDLEAPGLENFFSRSIDPEEARKAEGVVDLLSDAMETGLWPETSDWLRHTLEVRLPGSSERFRLLTAGRRPDGYFRKVQKLDFVEFYSTKDGGNLLERFRDQLKSEFDFVLVDSRTGFTEIGGLCTVQLPDLIVLLFTPTRQALAGAIDMAGRAFAARQRLPFQRPVVPILPIPSRLDMSAEFRLTQRWLDTFAGDLRDIFADWLPRTVQARSMLEILKLPHVPFFSYGESLPVLEQGTVDPSGLGYAYETLAALVEHDLQGVELLTSDRSAYIRESSNAAPEITKDSSKTHIFFSYSNKDRRWMEMLRTHLTPLLRSRGLSIWDETRPAPGRDWTHDISDAISRASLVVIIVSAEYLASDFVYSVELPAILAASISRALPVVWIAASHSLFPETPVARFKALNDPNTPLDSMDQSRQHKLLASIAPLIAELAGQPY